MTWTCFFLGAASFLMPLEAGLWCLGCLVRRGVDDSVLPSVWDGLVLKLRDVHSFLLMV
jgi:hypothetical protein